MLKAAPERKVTFPIRGQWFPDAFGGSMGEMMTALTEGREPQTSGRDNLRYAAQLWGLGEDAPVIPAAAQ